MLRYKQEFEKAGYKVNLQKFMLFLSPMVKQIKEGEDKHNSPFYYY